MRVTRQRSRRSRRPHSPAAEFVAAVVARHTRGVASWFAPERAARRPHAIPAAVHHHLHQGDRQHFSLRFDIGLAPALGVRVEPTLFRPWKPAPPTAVAPLPAPAAPRRSLVQRIVGRERRVETRMTMRKVLRDAVTRQREGADALPVPPSPPRARPVEMVVHRLRIAAPELARAAPPAGPRGEAGERVLQPSVFRSTGTPVPAPLSAAEIGRVTDHVVRAIDRRLVAQRERRGKI
jgi:hypothetical protein